MKVLIFTRSAWDNNNSIGSTMSNLWSNFDKMNLANLYFRSALPRNNVCIRYYSISDLDIIKGLLSLNFKIGREYYQNYSKNISDNQLSISVEKNFYSYFRKYSSTLIKLFQELLWHGNLWKNKNLNNFLKDFQPDIIFFPCFSAIYTHKVLWHCADISKAYIVLFHADDYLTSDSLKGESILFQFVRNKLRSTVKKSAIRADLNYCISPKQQEVYQSILNIEMGLLYKGADFSSAKKPYYFDQSKPIKIVYIGSTLYGRWKTLGILAKAIKEINREKQYFELNIYSQYEPTREASNAMIIEGASKYMGKIPANQVALEYEKADIVLHVESFDEKEKLKTRLSFSTKIVDCLHSARCLIAIGWEEAASIDYLRQNDAALIVNQAEDIKLMLQNIKDNPALLTQYSEKAWECGKRNHQIDDIQAGLNNDLKQLLNR